VNRERIDLLVTGASEVLTCAADAPDLVGRITDGGVAIDAGRIVAVGDISGYVADRVVDAAGGVVLPGFVDAHTHLVFGGSRIDEYAAAVAGVDPPDDVPVGIMGTVTETRRYSTADLISQAEPRVIEMLDHGTTTVEAKSGYGLSDATERKLLQAAAELHRRLPADIVSTYLGAHAYPSDVEPSRYVEQIIDFIPEVAEMDLAVFCDVYCDRGFFSLEETHRILKAGRDAGLWPKIHLDAYSHTDAAAIAIELEAASVDHLNFTPVHELELLADAGIVGVYMPALEFSVAHPQPFEPRVAMGVGMELALATDMCPGCWTSSMQFTIVLACRLGGMSVAQAVRAATYGAARSLKLDGEIGSLIPGARADLVLLDVVRYEEIAYRLARNAVTTVIKGGVVVREQAA